MADILSQTEVESLLSALDAGPQADRELRRERPPTAPTSTTDR